MPIPDSTCWDVIEKAASGDKARRQEFVRRYTPVIVEYLRVRWQGTPLLAEVEDAANEVFLECFRQGGALERVDSSRPGGFRAFFLGVIRNIRRRVEDARARNRELQASTDYDPADGEAAYDTSASRVLDRAWARAILAQAGTRYREAAKAEGEEALRRVELLRLRFHDDLPIREIASRWAVNPEKLHQQYRRARREFRRFLEAELGMQGKDPNESDRQWKAFLSLLR